MYRVIEYFTDIKDGGHAYNVGDIFPREGVTVSDERLKELSGVENKRGKALIEAVKEKKAEAEAETVTEQAEPAEVEQEQPKKKKSKRS